MLWEISVLLSIVLCEYSYSALQAVGLNNRHTAKDQKVVWIFKTLSSFTLIVTLHYHSFLLFTPFISSRQHINNRFIIIAWTSSALFPINSCSRNARCYLYSHFTTQASSYMHVSKTTPFRRSTLDNGACCDFERPICINMYLQFSEGRFIHSPQLKICKPISQRVTGLVDCIRNSGMWGNRQAKV